MSARSPARRFVRALALAAVATALLAGCVQTTPQVIKIGLVAPFEGRYREIGDDVIPAARLAIREWAARAKGPGLVFELVAYDDHGDPALAVEQARKLATDPDVVAVVGHWRNETTLAALPVYAEAGLSLVTFTSSALPDAPNVINLAPAEEELRHAVQLWSAGQSGASVVMLDGPPEVADAARQFAAARSSEAGSVIGGPDWSLRQFYALAGDGAEGALYVTGEGLPVDAAETALLSDGLDAFLDGYREGSLGAEPGPHALTAYQATWVAMARAAEALGYPAGESPASVVSFDEHGRRVGAPVFLYRWQGAQRTLVARLR